MPTPSKPSSSKSSKSKAPKARSETTGAAPSSVPTSQNPEKGTPSVAETLAAGKTPSAGNGTVTTASPSPTRPQHQTDGCYAPITGPITNVRQLVRGPNMAKNSIGSFATMAAYGDYLRTLRPTDLHLHAVNEARIVPIDDTARLIRRLEANWTAVAARESSRTGNAIPSRKPFTTEQLAEQEKIRRQMLGRRA